MACAETMLTATRGAGTAHQVSTSLPTLMAAAASDTKPDTNPDKEAPVHFTKVVLYTAADGRAHFREEAVLLAQGEPQARFSALMPSGGLQLRMSPVGFRSDFHCTEHPQWLFVLGGQMEIGLQDGSKRRFGPGEHFFSADTVPQGASFDPALHGHCSRQVGDEPLITAFVRA